MTSNKWLDAARLIALTALTLLLGAFHGFVGFHKAFSTHEELVQHAAWTMHLPMWLGKTVGWVEMIVTAGLLVALFQPRLWKIGMWGGIWFAVLEVVAGVVHYVSQDGGSVVQNVVSILLTCLMAWLFALRGRQRPGAWS